MTGQAETGQAETGQAETGQAETGQADARRAGLAGATRCSTTRTAGRERPTSRPLLPRRSTGCSAAGSAAGLMIRQ
jgi:hypothetical protein